MRTSSPLPASQVRLKLLEAAVTDRVHYILHNTVAIPNGLSKGTCSRSDPKDATSPADTSPRCPAAGRDSVMFAKSQQDLYQVGLETVWCGKYQVRRGGRALMFLPLTRPSRTNLLRNFYGCVLLDYILILVGSELYFPNNSGSFKLDLYDAPTTTQLHRWLLTTELVTENNTIDTRKTSARQTNPQAGYHVLLEEQMMPTMSEHKRKKYTCKWSLLPSQSTKTHSGQKVCHVRLVRITSHNALQKSSMFGCTVPALNPCRLPNDLQPIISNVSSHV
ncbi:hypothetical protein T12_13579 [Trichinella patagoniensis]|uniref:Uncharacterized protein n=1 Tax=Trichinella patagoniensis TaxID=990121 RepID=A0A0V0ZPE5_9BILA|nr:hypothetical protein T12_13579 [Trichinella patagoniensis]